MASEDQTSGCCPCVNLGMMLCNPWVTGHILWFNQRIIVFLNKWSDALHANPLQFLLPQEFKIWSGNVDKDEIRLVLALIPEQLLLPGSILL